MPEPQKTWDVFLSHGTPDKPWVETLASELEALSLHPFLDAREIETADSFPHVLSEGLDSSRFLALILSPQSARPWVNLEWASFLSHHGPLGRLIPVLLEPTEVPALLASIQRIDATDRDAARAAREIARIAGRPGQLKEGDARRLALGQDLVFNISREGDDLRIIDPLGRTRTVTPPWRVDNRFWAAHHFFDRLTREPVTTDADRADLMSRATILGSLLFDLLFDEEGCERLCRAMTPGRPRPLITIRSDDDLLLSFPWELLWHDGSFLLRDARLDLARSAPGEVGPEALLREPDGYLKLVVNVSAPEGSGLDYEGESYRITRALSERCRFVPTELGTVEDLVDTVQAERPTAIHFSGHGTPGALAFEDDEGREDVVPIHDLLLKLRTRVEGGLPPLFYLASCHGNDSGAPRTANPKEEKSGAESSAARLHREGVPQVVGYYGPIVDELSTRAEVAFYRALAEGETTRYAVRQAREALAASFWAPDSRHRPRTVAEPGEVLRAGSASAAVEARHTHPFAWAQLVFYHRGPDHPLSLPAAAGARPHEPVLHRSFEGIGDRRVLTTGFIGRRSELHRIRRWIRGGRRVFVFQGLGGLGKSTLAFHAIPMLLRGEGVAVTLWCQEVEQRSDRAQALVGQLLDFCRKRFGVEWEPVVFQVDRVAGDDPVQRFALFLHELLQRVPRLVLYLDNLESLLVSPQDPQMENDESVLGQWTSEDLGRLWQILTELARDHDRVYLVASCRYRNPDFTGTLLPVSPLPPDALYRLMGWFPALRRLSGPSRERLVGRLAGHPRAVEYANDLLAHALAEREDCEGPWHSPENPTEADTEREWADLVDPLLPRVQDKLWANLLLAEIWDRVLDDRPRRMLYRMSLLRRPWRWKLVAVLGEEGEGEEVAFTTAERLRRTSLLQVIELLVWRDEGRTDTARRYTLDPATQQFVRKHFEGEDTLRQKAHRQIGKWLEVESRKYPDVETTIEAGYHLFRGNEYDRSAGLLGPASEWLMNHGQVLEGVSVLEPLLERGVRSVLSPEHAEKILLSVGAAGLMLGNWREATEYSELALDIAREIGDKRVEGCALCNLGVTHYRLGEIEKAGKYHEQALAIAVQVGDRRSQGAALCNFGLTCAALGEVDRAIKSYMRALRIFREIKDRQSEGAVLSSLGLACLDQGKHRRALILFCHSLASAREIGDLLNEARALGNIGLTLMGVNETEEAIDFYEQQLVIVREIGDRLGEANALGNLGLAYAKVGEVGKAVSYYESQLRIVCEIGDRRGEGSALANMGVAYSRLGETGKAITLLERALQIGRAIKDPGIIQTTTKQLARLRGT